MKIYLGQHAEAVASEVDADRPISESGAESAGRVAARVAQHRAGITAIRHSGKLRARQTADVFAGHLGIKDVSEIPGMNPGDSAEEFVKGLNREGVLYIGHLPHLDKVLSRLIGGSRDKGVVTFKNAGIACIELGDSEPTLCWYITPDIC